MKRKHAKLAMDNDAAMLAAFDDMATEFDYVFDCSDSEKSLMNNRVLDYYNKEYYKILIFI